MKATKGTMEHAIQPDDVYLPVTIRHQTRRVIIATPALAVMLDGEIGEPLEETTIVEEAFGRPFSVAVEYRRSHAGPPSTPAMESSGDGVDGVAEENCTPAFEHSFSVSTVPPALAAILEMIPHETVLFVQERQAPIDSRRAVVRNRWINTGVMTPSITGRPLEFH
ncbi:hypothetical protein GCM10027568_09580 [Humibacter soli]